MKKILSYALMLASTAFIGCSNDDTTDSTNQKNSITATINGKSWIGTKINSVTLLRDSNIEEQRFDINAQDGSQILHLACESELTTTLGIPAKTYIFNEDEIFNNNALFLNYYLIGGNSYLEHFVHDGVMTITSINIEKKTISGTFSFKANKVGVLQDQIVTPDVIEVTNGAFTNLTYTVINN